MKNRINILNDIADNENDTSNIAATIEKESEKRLHLVVDESDINTRIDKYIADELDGYSRSFIQKLIKDNNVLVNGRAVKPNYNIGISDNIDIVLPKLTEPQIEAENISLDII